MAAVFFNKVLAIYRLRNNKEYVLLDEDSLNNVRKSLLTFAETMTTFSVTMKNITQNMIPALQNFAVIAERLGEVIRNTIS